MAIIYFNGKSFEIPEAALGVASGALRNHLSSVMNGSGATINFGGTAYGIDSTKLATATSKFVSHLGTVAGSGYKVKVGDVEFGVDSTKVAGAFDSFNAVLNDLVASGGATLGFPIVWNSMEVMGNPSVIVGGEMPFVKVSDFIPTAEDFVGTEISAMGEAFSCEDMQEMSGLVLAAYGEDSMYILSVATAGEYADLGIIFSETGLYALDFGSMGLDVDFILSPPMSTLATPEIFLENKILTITPVENATGYEVYIDDKLNCTIVETVVDLSNELDDDDSCYVAVRAIAPKAYYASDYIYTWYSLTDPEPGLFDANDILLAQWSSLVNDYGLDVIKDYAASAYESNHPQNAASSLYNILRKNTEFSTCSKLIIPDSVTSIGNGAFHSCGLTSIVIPDSVTSIGEYAFYFCGLTNIVIPNNVTNIGKYAFYNCKLTNIVIPNSVTNIGEYAFSSCLNLAAVTYNGTVAQWNAITKGKNWNDRVPATHVQCSDGQVAL